jgi:hypothetical protein
VGVDAAKSAQPTRASAHATPVGQFDAARVADHHMGDGAAAVDQHAHLSTAFAAEFGHRPGEFLVDDPVRRDAAARKPFEAANEVGLEAVGVAEDLDGFALARVGLPVVGRTPGPARSSVNLKRRPPRSKREGDLPRGVERSRAPVSTRAA